jgi:hypothetical protein
MTAMVALLLAMSTTCLPAYAGSDTVAYKPGVIEQAAANGETVLLHYKSTW